MIQFKKFPKPFWIIILATLMHQLGNMALVFLMAYLTISKQFSLALSSVLFAAFSGAMLIGSAFSHYLLAWVQPTSFLMVILFVNAACLLFLPLCHHEVSLLIIIIIWGISFGAFRPISQVLVSEFSNQNSHRLTFAIHRWVINLGMSIGPAVGGYLAAYSFRSIYFVNGFADFIAGFILLVNLKKFHQKNNSSSTAIVKQKLFWLKDHAFLFFLAGLLPVSMIFFQHESTLAIFLTTHLSLPLSFYGLLFTLNTILIIALEFPLNLFMMHWQYRSNFLIGSLFIGLGFFGLAFVTTAWQIVILAICWTVGEMIFYPSASSFVAEISTPEQRGAYMSMYSTCSNLGMLFGPLGGGFLISTLGANALWYGCGTLTFIAFYFFIKIVINPKNIETSHIVESESRI